MTLSLPYDQTSLCWTDNTDVTSKTAGIQQPLRHSKIQDRIIGQMELLFQVTPILELSSDSRNVLSLTEVEL